MQKTHRIQGNQGLRLLGTRMTAKKTAPAYDKKALQEIAELLHEKKNALLEKYAHWEDNSRPSGLKEMGDIADIASEINEETLSSVLSEAEIETIREIDAALGKNRRWYLRSLRRNRQKNPNRTSQSDSLDPLYRRIRGNSFEK